MSADILTPDQLGELAALETTPGPWVARRVAADSGRDAAVGIVADGERLATMVAYSWESGAGRRTDMLNAEEDGALAAAAPSLLATALHLLERAERAEAVHPQILRLAREVASPGAEDMVDMMTTDDLETLVDVVIRRLQRLQTAHDETSAVLDEADADREDDEGYVMPLWDRVADLADHALRMEAERDEARARIARLERVLAVERGDESQAPEG